MGRPPANRNWCLRGVLLFRLGEDAAQVFGSELSVLVDEVQSYGLAIDDRQGMAELEAGVSFIPDVHEAERFGEGFLVALHRDAGRAAVVLAAEMPDRLKRSDLIETAADTGLVSPCSSRASKQILRRGEAISFTMRRASAYP